MPPPAVTVFIIDDDKAVRILLVTLLKSAGLAVKVFESADEFLPTYDPREPGCLLLDIHMPGSSGLELQQQLNLRGAIIPVIFISGSGDLPIAVEAMKHGAFDYLEKPFLSQALLERVRRALTVDAANRAQLKETERNRERFESLTGREREVATLMMSGKANKAMAGDLDISQRTVEMHRARVMEKMEARSLAQLVRLMIDLDAPGTTGLSRVIPGG